MCGIVGYVGNKNATETLLSGLRKLEYRGYDSAGLAILENGKIRIEKTKGRLSQLEKHLQKGTMPQGSCGVGHTRWATHGEPSDKNSHPHGDEHLAVVHNGIIENDEELRTFLQNNGYSFVSDTDTEVIVRLLDYYYRGDPQEAIRKTVLRLRGSYALAILFCDFPDCIFAIRKDSPLIVGLGKEETVIASDLPAVLKQTTQYLLPDENEIVTATAQSVTVTSLSGEVLTKPVLHAQWHPQEAEKNGFEHFMLKEIYEEPQILRQLLSARMEQGQPFVPELDDSFLLNIRRIRLIACGTAMHAALACKIAIETLCKLPAEVICASEFRYSEPIFFDGELDIFISQSGETADTLAALRLAREHRIKTLAIVNAVDSSVAREADCVLYTHAGPEIAVASTKAYLAQVVLLFIVSIRLGIVTGKLEMHKARVLCAGLLEAPLHIEQILAKAEQIKRLAALVAHSQHLFFIGRLLDYAIGLEGSLKVKEVSYLHSEAYPAGELKHGPISLITPGTPVIALMTQPQLYEKMRLNVQEVFARGAHVIVIRSAAIPFDTENHDHTLILPPCDPLFAPLYAGTLLQLLAYYTAVLRGCDVDHPRNLAKSVTVE